MFTTVWLNSHPQCLENVTAIFFRTVNDCLTKDELPLVGATDFQSLTLGQTFPWLKKVVFDSEYVNDSCETEAWERVFLSFLNIYFCTVEVFVMFVMLIYLRAVVLRRSILSNCWLKIHCLLAEMSS